jgi:hypothetical protein
VWGDVVTVAFSTEEGAFLRGQVRMEETVELDLEPPAQPGALEGEPAPLDETPPAQPDQPDQPA